MALYNLFFTRLLFFWKFFFFYAGGFGGTTRETTFSSFRARQTSKTGLKFKFWVCPRNDFVISSSLHVQNCGDMKILKFPLQPVHRLRFVGHEKTVAKRNCLTSQRHFVVVGRLKLWWNAPWVSQISNFTNVKIYVNLLIYWLKFRSKIYVN